MIKFSDFRALIPSWVFFDDYAANNSIQIRFVNENGTFDEWKNVFEAIPRNFFNLFLAPQSNFQLYEISCFDELLEISQEHVDNPEKVLSQDSLALCAQILSQKFPDSNDFQFKIRDAFYSPTFKNTP